MAKEPRIPMPIASIVLPPSMNVSGEITRQGLDDLQRIDQALQRHMQSLLDAQSSLLFIKPAGGPNAVKGHSSEKLGSSQLNQSSGLQQASSQPPNTKPGLRDVRKDIHTTMLKLLNVKSQQVERSTSRLEIIRGVHARIERWDRKEHELKSTIDSLRYDERDEEARKLSDEENALQEQIVAMENQLSNLRAQKQAVYRKRTGIENSLHAKASSYEGSLSMLVKEKAEFLRRPPQELTSVLDTIDATVMKTSPKRRTLLQLSAGLKDAEEEEVRKRDDSNAEVNALTGGVEKWKDTIRQVDGVELAIAAGLKKLGSAETATSDAQRNTERLLQALNQGIAALQDLLDDAEKHGWSLLVCCIGAELEAMKHGMEVIQKSLTLVQQQESQDLNSGHDHESDGGLPHADDKMLETDPQSLLLSTEDAESD